MQRESRCFVQFSPKTETRTYTARYERRFPLSASAITRNSVLWIVGLWIAAIFLIPAVVNFAYRLYHYENPIIGTMHFEPGEVSPSACSSMFGAQASTTDPCVVRARYTRHPLNDDFVVFLDNGNEIMFPQSHRPWMIVGEPRMQKDKE